ncbi:uncharacterized protein LOC119995480 [Tripterygium wilfordii]|nr:uncharacterized protein LOC119995480 [Tripterygium wilfordii]
MAGLQWNFFPTDILYPKTQTSGTETTTLKVAVPLQTQKRDHDEGSNRNGLLQYNFFPTDFFYPKPPQAAPALPMKALGDFADRDPLQRPNIKSS